MKKLWNVRLLSILVVVIGCISLIWCWNSWTWNSSLSVNIYWFELNYNGNIELKKAQLKTDDLDEILDLYQEVWDNSEYRDSLLIAEKHAQWLWANAFAVDNLDTLENQWLSLSNIKKTQIRTEKYWEEINAVLVEYEITQWLISEIPVLYVSQLFVPNGETMVLMSFISENQSSRLSASNMFKNIK